MTRRSPLAPPVEWHDVQGLVISGYASMREARYLLLEITDAAMARQWVAGLADRVTASHQRQEARCINVALTVQGLAALELSEAELITFAVPFREGMTTSHRQRVLGDVGQSAPRYWEWGAAGAKVAAADALHVLLLLYATTTAVMDEVEAEELRGLERGGLRVVHRLLPEPFRPRFGKFGVEHFGFADGVSQPVIEGSGPARSLSADETRRSVVAAGEFILGYPNGYGQFTPWPQLSSPNGSAFGRNGTYLVTRQLAQDVAGFWKFAQNHSTGDGTDVAATAGECIEV